MQDYLKRFSELADDPSGLSRLHMDIADRFAKVSKGYADAVPAISDLKRNIRESCKSMSAAEYEYDLSLIGQEERKWKLELKALEKLMGSIRQRQETLKLEVHNQI